jgi:hypothetical protein
MVVVFLSENKKFAFVIKKMSFYEPDCFLYSYFE